MDSFQRPIENCHAFARVTARGLRSKARSISERASENSTYALRTSCMISRAKFSSGKEPPEAKPRLPMNER